MSYLRTSFCKNLHAKCYLNENRCIITSLNLYEFSQINNNEMGILLSKDEDSDVYRDAYEEAQRIVRISDEIRMTLEHVSHSEEDNSSADEEATDSEKLATSKLAKKLGISTTELLTCLTSMGFLNQRDDKYFLTDKGKASGGEFRHSKRYGPYFLWPSSLTITPPAG